MTMLSRAALLLPALLAAPALAQVIPGHQSTENGVGPVAPCAWTDSAGRPVLCSPTTGLPVSGTNSVPDGWDVAEGSRSDQAATTTDATPTSTIAQLKQIVVKLNAAIAGINAPTPSGSNSIGSVLSPYDAAYVFAPPGGAAESSNLASYAYSTTSTTAGRGFYAICAGAGTVTLTGVNGGTVAGWPLTAGLQYHPFRITSFAANIAACTIGMLF